MKKWLKMWELWGTSISVNVDSVLARMQQMKVKGARKRKVQYELMAEATEELEEASVDSHCLMLHPPTSQSLLRSILCYVRAEISHGDPVRVFFVENIADKEQTFCEKVDLIFDARPSHQVENDCNRIYDKFIKIDGFYFTVRLKT